MKRLTSFFLSVVLLLSFAGNAFADEGTTPPDQTEDTTEVSYLDDTGDPVSDPAEESSEEEDHQPEELSETQAEHPRIEQIYGGGGKGKTPISNSFVELCNPSDAEIDLSGYALKDGEKTIELSGKIPANGFYLGTVVYSKRKNSISE